MDGDARIRYQCLIGIPDRSVNRAGTRCLAPDSTRCYQNKHGLQTRTPRSAHDETSSDVTCECTFPDPLWRGGRKLARTPTCCGRNRVAENCVTAAWKLTSDL